ENYDVRLEETIDVIGISHHLLVIDEGKESGVLIELEPLRIEPHYKANIPVGETSDLRLPFRLHGCRGNDKHASDALFSCENLAGGKGLDGLAEPHLVGQKRTLMESQMRCTFALIGQERQLDEIEAGIGRGKSGEKFLPRLLARGEPPLALDPGTEMA